MNRQGFTLVELVIVTMIIGILSAMAAPRFADSLARYRVEAAARQLRCDLTEARLRARTTSASQIVLFDAAAHSYELPDVADIDHPGAVYEIHLPRRFRATIAALDCGGDAELNFDGYGMPDSGAEIVVRCGVHHRTVRIAAETGLASVH